jgi:FkbM family methyltransferase
MPLATIYCFEPDPRAIARFKKHLGSQLDKVKLFEIAVSDRNGKIDFHTSTSDDPLGHGFDQSGSIRRPKTPSQGIFLVKFEKTIVVETRRLDDSLYIDPDQVDFFKESCSP